MDRSTLLKLPLAASFALLLLAGCASKLETYRKEGVALYKHDQYDQSLATLEKAIAIDAFDPVSNAYAGLIQYRAGHLQQAEYHFRTALNADPSSEEAKAGLTITLIRQGKPDKALDALERAAELSQKVDDPRWLKTDVKRPYTKQVEERLFLGKVDDRVRIARAYASPEVGDYDNAFVYYQKALELTPNDPAILMAMADLAERAKNPAKAHEYLALTYKADPATPGLTAAMTRNGLAISDVIGGNGNGSKP